ncbi:MAG: phasin family protein [Rhodospirillales bacterium]
MAAAQNVNPAEPIEAAVSAGQETVEAAVKVSTEAATKSVEKAVAMTKENVAAAVKAGNDAVKNAEDLAAFGKENIEAVVASANIWTKGVQSYGQKVAELTKANVDESVAVAKKIFACKTPQEVIELQNAYAKSSYDKMVAETKALSDMLVKLSEEASKPVAARVELAVEKFSKPLAA